MEQLQDNQIVLGGGCFWCLEAVYQRIDGIESVVSGYAGGQVDNPTYEQVCTGETGHAEVVLVTFNPEKISLREVLNLFWKAHDPTTPNRQGHDVGTQYRSAIYYSTEGQRRVAEESMSEAQERFSAPIVTEVAPLDRFYPAEDYHQNYFNSHPFAGYCRVVIAPKLKKLSL
ncbi:MAG: peptide-methionine (S)-S-oxide reductase MsrA [Spirochaetaceae bacterium]